MAFSKA